MKTIIVKNNQLSPSQLKQVAETLKNGGLIVYPTDTVYGLGIDATNQHAVDKLLEFKGARNNKAISIAVKDQLMAEEYAVLNSTAVNLYQNFLPGPLTIISNCYPVGQETQTSSKNVQKLAKGITSIEGTVGIRIVPHPFLTQIFSIIDFPITATSANVSNKPPARSLANFKTHTTKAKRKLVDLFLDFGTLPYRQPSTVIDTSKEDTEIVRQGTIHLSSLNKFTHEKESLVNTQTYTSHSPEETQQIASQVIDQLLNSNYQLPLILALQGQLGAGKTVFTKGIAQTLEITEPLRSPTYTLVKEYSLPKTQYPELRTLFHIDAWRLSHSEELEDLGLEEMIQPENLIILEWAQRIHTMMESLTKKAKIIMISIQVIDENTRQIIIGT